MPLMLFEPCCSTCLARSSIGEAEWLAKPRRSSGAMARRRSIRSHSRMHGGPAYQPAMEQVRSGRRPFARLDVLHRENLEAILPEFGIDRNKAPASELNELNLAWHRLDPWPDVRRRPHEIEGRVHYCPALQWEHRVDPRTWRNARACPGTQSSARKSCKPISHRRRSICAPPTFSAMEPEQIGLVAAHNGDLAAARKCGMRTVFIPRPTEHGPNQTTDLRRRRGLGRDCWRHWRFGREARRQNLTL